MAKKVHSWPNKQYSKYFLLWNKLSLFKIYAYLQLIINYLATVYIFCFQMAHYKLRLQMNIIVQFTLYANMLDERGDDET